MDRIGLIVVDGNSKSGSSTVTDVLSALPKDCNIREHSLEIHGFNEEENPSMSVCLHN